MKFLDRLRRYIPVITTKGGLSDVVEDKINNALIEHDRYDLVGSGNNLVRSVSQNPFSGESIFDAIESINTGVLKKGEAKDISEGQWASVGFTINQDPNNVQTVEKLRLAQKASVYQWWNFPIAKSMIENLKRYILGKGIKIDSPVPEIQLLIKNFWTGNKMELRMKNICKEYFLKGEWFAMLFNNAGELGDDFDVEIDPLLLLRTLPSEEIDDIEYDPKDAETILAYRRIDNREDGVEAKFYLDISHPFGDEKELGIPIYGNGAKSDKEGKAEESRVMFMKHGLLFDPRGRVFMDTVLRWNRVYVDFVYNRCQLNHLRTKIFLIETRTGRSGKTVSSSATTERMPKGGMKLIETPDRVYRLVAPNTGASDADTDIKILLYLISSGVSMPLHILTMDASNNNFASIKEAGTPFVQMIHDYQDDFAEKLKELFRFLIMMALRGGHIKETYDIESYPEDAVSEAVEYISMNLKSDNYEDVLEQAKSVLGKKNVRTVKAINVPISITFPEIVKADLQQQAAATKIYHELGLVSKHTSRMHLGLDPDVEEFRIDAESRKESEKAEEDFRRRNTGQGTEPKLEKEEPEKPESKESEESIFYESEEELEIIAELFSGLSESDVFDLMETEDKTLIERQKRYRVANEKKIAARQAVHKALRAGGITKPSVCQASGCNVAGKLWAHHANYNKPLEVRWLCKAHTIAADNKKQGKGSK